MILRADSNLTTLIDVARRSLYAAQNGGNGRGATRTGRNGKHLVIDVPVGTILREVPEGEPTKKGAILGELIAPGRCLVVARGGRGGRGNKAFATSTRQAPRFAEEGEAGIEKVLYLELKLLADVGLIGLPNSGKSTLLARVSAATPKIADYPFTTLHPHLGIVELGDYRRLVIADIPGLIEGAHQGSGLGIEFLRHIERTRVLVHLVSVEPVMEALASGDQDGAVVSLERDYRMVEGELASYSSQLSKKSRTVALSKADLIRPGDMNFLLEHLSRSLQVPVLPLSGVSGDGLLELLRDVDGKVQSCREADC